LEVRRGLRGTGRPAQGHDEMKISFCGVRRELSERRKKGWGERRFRSQICSISMKSGVSEFGVSQRRRRAEVFYKKLNC